MRFEKIVNMINLKVHKVTTAFYTSAFNVTQVMLSVIWLSHDTKFPESCKWLKYAHHSLNISSCFRGVSTTRRSTMTVVLQFQVQYFCLNVQL